MRATTTDRLLAELNELRGVSDLRAIGHSYYADIRGDGRNIRRVYTIVNAGGGVTFSSLNGRNSRDTCSRIRHAIAAEKAQRAEDRL